MDLYDITYHCFCICSAAVFFFCGRSELESGSVFTEVTMWVAHKIEKEKKAHDLGTYKEIKMFMEGKRLDEIEKLREEGKRPYQRWFLAVLCLQWLVLLLRQELQLCSIILEYCKIITAMRNNTIIDTVARSFENVPILFRQKTTVDIHWHIIFSALFS